MPQPILIRFQMVSLLALWAATLPCSAERRALLIGVGEYPKSPQTRSLEGPPRDVVALREMLIKHWGFTPVNIVSLVNAQAGRAGMLAAIDRLAAQAQPGDQVFIFYSGHGTSSDDLATRGLGLDSNTGAIVPADIRAGSPSEIYAQLIVASRDLRARFKAIEAKAETLVIFDACYSGESVKGIARSKLVPRYTDFGLIPKGEVRKPASDDEFGQIGAVKVNKDAYPYRNLLYISASAKSERSWDIPSALIRAREIDTFDHQPHGALTDSLLRGLSGQADTDHNGIITYRELYQFVLQDVQPRFSQQPQFLAPPSNPELSSRSLFAAKGAPRANVSLPSSGKIRVKLDFDDVALSARLRALPDIEVSQTDFDLRIARERERYSLIHTSGTLIDEYSRADIGALLNRIGLQPQVQALADYRLPKQDFNVVLRIDPPAKEVFYLGDRQIISLTPDAESYLLLLNIDIKGEITVIYPNNQAQTEPVAANHTVRCVETAIDLPVGTEYLKVFAFRQKPPEFNAWIGKEFLPTQPFFPALLDMVRRGANSQTRFLSFSTDKRRPD